MEKHSPIWDTVELVVSVGEAIISLHALSSFSAPQTLKTKGYIKHHRLVVLNNYGNTHNFISMLRDHAIHYFIHPVNNFHIFIANWGMMKCGSCCENVKLQVGDYHLKTHIFSIDMGSCDIMLRDEWLRILDLVTMDFKDLYIRFLKDSHTHNI